MKRNFLHRFLNRNIKIGALFAASVLGIGLSVNAASPTEEVKPSASKPDTLTIALSGDILLATTYGAINLPANGGNELLKDVKHLLESADFTVGNLEGPLADSTNRYTTKKGAHSFAFRCPPRYGKLLKDAGYDFLSLANNHIRDFGEAGVNQTVSTLNDLGIAHAGDIFHANFALVERNGIRYGCCAFGHNSYTHLHTDTALVKETLATLRSKCDVLIVSFHGGSEGVRAKRLPYGREIFFGENRGELRKFAHLCIRQGADLVFGHGPHVPRCVEVYNDKFIAYSLGNFCTPFGMSMRGECSYAPLIRVRIKPDGTFIDGQIHSFRQEKGVGPRVDSLRSCAKEIKTLTELDIRKPVIEINDKGEIKRRVATATQK